MTSGAATHRSTKYVSVATTVVSMAICCRLEVRTQVSAVGGAEWVSAGERFLQVCLFCCQQSSLPAAIAISEQRASFSIRRTVVLTKQEVIYSVFLRPLSNAA